MSLTAINLAKIVHWIPKKDKNPNEEITFSMSDVKTQYYNGLLINPDYALEKLIFTIYSFTSFYVIDILKGKIISTCNTINYISAKSLMRNLG